MLSVRYGFGILVLALTSHPADAAEADIIKMLKEKGGEVVEIKGVATSVTLTDGSKLTDAEFRQIGQLKQLKNLTLSKCLNDQTLAFLTGLAELETLQTNLMEVSDDGIKQFAQLKKLRNLKFFHPGKTFTGSGLAALTEMPNLEALTIAGSFAFGDDGMAAISKLTQLKSLRIWHVGQTDEGVIKLRSLKNLKSLTLGQRLTYKPPANPSNETLAILAELKSLETLQLEEARLTLSGLENLKRLPELKTLTLNGIDMPEADVERLQKDLPKVAVKWTRPNETYMKRIRALFANE